MNTNALISSHEINNEKIRLPFDEVCYPESISVAAAFCPEIAEQESEMKEAARELVQAYQPTSDFFAAPDNAVGLLFASALYVNAKNSEGKASARIARESSLADNFAWLVFGDYSPVRPHAEKQEVSNLSSDERIKLFRRYENPALSNKLQVWMHDSVELEDVREALGITRDESKEFIPVVLRVGTGVHMRGIGKAPGAPDMSSQIKEWKKNAKQFMTEQGSADDDTLPFAWVSTLEGNKYLCFPEPIALALLDPESVGFQDEGGIRDYLKSLIKHEYVHVQTKLEVEDPNDDEKGGHLGGLLSEYQAEVFSGFNFDFAYPDIYSFVEQVESSSNLSIQEVIKRHKKGGGEDKPGFYFDFINTIGLVPSAMLISAMTEDDIKYQSTEAGRLLAESFTEYSLADELTVRNGWEGVLAFLKRGDVELDSELSAYWSERLEKLASS